MVVELTDEEAEEVIAALNKAGAEFDIVEWELLAESIQRRIGEG